MECLWRRHNRKKTPFTVQQRHFPGEQGRQHIHQAVNFLRTLRDSLRLRGTVANRYD